VEEVSEFEVQEKGAVYNISDRAYFFAKEIVAFVKEVKYDRIYFSLFDQLLRSATSIGANLVEGKAGSSKKDWIKFHVIALKSANETKYWLCLIKDCLDVDKNRIQNLINEANEISKIVASIVINAGKNE
jgi:four helix bundle protein